MAKVVQGATVSVEGFRELMLGLHNAGKDTERYSREALRHAGDAVKEDATRKFSKYDKRTSEGYRVRVRRIGVSVEQSIRRTTGMRPDFGALQMRRALIPALQENTEETMTAMEEAVTLVTERLEATMLPVGA
jgi:hypothetical protein